MPTKNHEEIDITEPTEPDARFIPKESSTPSLLPEKEVRLEIERFQTDTAGILKIDNWEIYKKVGEEIKTLKMLIDKVKKTFDPIIKKQREALEETRAKMAEVMRPLMDQDRQWKAGMSLFYNQEQEKKRLAEQESTLKAQKEAEQRKKEEASALKKAGRTEEAKAVLESPTVAPPIVRPDAEKMKGVYHRTFWRARIINADAVPREYCVPDQSKLDKIAAAMKGGQKIPGVEFFSETKTIARA